MIGGGRPPGETAPADPRIAPPGEGLAARRDRLYARLEDGWARIDQVEGAGGDAGALVDFWIELLREYERACDALAAEECSTTIEPVDQ